jgi:hypothetical protein
MTGAWNAVPNGSSSPETVLFWQHVRAANLAAGSTDMTNATTGSLPSNAEGGRFGVQMVAPIAGMTGTYFACSAGIPFGLAQQLDLAMDDGVGTTGNMRAIAVETEANSAVPDPGDTVTTPTSVAYTSGVTYTLCQSF